MPTEQERAEFPDFTDADWERVARARAALAEIRERNRQEGPGFEERVLAALDAQTELLRAILDRLPRTD